jgi:hypothetical protein
MWLLNYIYIYMHAIFHLKRDKTDISIAWSTLPHHDWPDNRPRPARPSRAGLRARAPKPAAPESCLPRVPPETVHVSLSTESNSPLQWKINCTKAPPLCTRIESSLLTVPRSTNPRWKVLPRLCARMESSSNGKKITVPSGPVRLNWIVMQLNVCKFNLFYSTPKTKWLRKIKKGWAMARSWRGWRR